jgi:hypothetical protein
MNFVPLLLVHLCNTLPALSMLMIARCGVTAETACWLVCEQSCSTNLASIIKGVSHVLYPCC